VPSSCSPSKRPSRTRTLRPRPLATLPPSWPCSSRLTATTMSTPSSRLPSSTSSMSSPRLPRSLCCAASSRRSSPSWLPSS
jgi:hypothetical protein